MKKDNIEPDPEIEKAWIEEAERRLDEIENGEVETIPGPEAMNELKKIAEA
ncbi:addiction module protein [Fodinibius sp. Rm-B-1B1-1]|uniref:addiction module protein n=1 Tax=Fodinibius alkaliphilus TaxID=3140241 RepID=UPI00315B0103